jgi:putative tryptophan/tyrosine transport system ATP-binding protein
MVRLENVTMIFNQGTPDENRALKNLTLTVKEGDFITIIGSNGAGKTTLFDVIAGSQKPAAGKILLNDVDITRLPEHRRARRIGRIYQNPLLGTAGTMSLEDNMMVSSRKGFKWPVFGLTPKKRELFRRELARLDMGLEKRLRENVRLFSGGQRQALTLLMMVLSRPDLILLDEHTAALDPKNAELVLRLTLEFIREHSLTAMMITHNMSHAITYGNRLLMMDAGEIIFEAAGEEKHNLTIEKLVRKFHELRARDLESDEVRLS